MRFFHLFILPWLLLASSLEGVSQPNNVFDRVEAECPELPKGLLYALSFTNTQCHHLTDADYTADPADPSSMPRAYGMMGLVKDGKGWFRENLKTVADLSGYEEAAILEDPYIHVLAYAKACVKLADQYQIDRSKVEQYAPVIVALSELPLGEEKENLPLKMMLYSVYEILGADLPGLFGEDYELLSAPGLSLEKGPDYEPAIWVPAPECNFSERTHPVSAVVIHYTEGSYAGCISWFQNCDAQVSAHYVIRSSDGQVTQMVREADKAWHARSANAYTIGIEHEAYGDIVSFFTEAMYGASAALVRDLCSRYESIDGHRTFYTDTLDDGRALNTGLWDLGGEGACIRIRGHQHYPDQSHTDPGPYWDWNYYYKLINEGDPIEPLGGPGVSSGTLNHLNYGDDERKIWVIKSDENTTITLRFSLFDLEKDYDFLWVYDGDNVYAPKLGRWNTMSPGSVTSTSNAMCIEFRSDCATHQQGWEATWVARDHTSVVEDSQIEMKLLQREGELLLQPADLGDYQVVMVDLYGRVVAQQRFSGSATINLNPLAQGLYLLRCTRVSDGVCLVRRIIR